MTVPRNLNRWVDGDSGREAVRRTLVEMDQRLARFEQVLALSKTGGTGNGRELGLSEFQQRQVLDLVAGRSTSVIGQDTPDPVLAGLNSGTVTSFSAGDLNPLFTTNEATVTTTPVLTFAQINQNANLIFAGPASGAAAAPTFRVLSAADSYLSVATLLQSTVLDLDVITKQTLYTVPSGKSAIVMALALRGPSVDLGAGGTNDLSFGFNAGSNNWAVSFAVAPLNGATKFLVLDQFSATSGGSSVIGTAAQIFGAICNAAYGSPATVVVDVFGYLF